MAAQERNTQSLSPQLSAHTERIERIAVPMSGQSNLDYLREVKRGLTPEQQHSCDQLTVGILSVHVPEEIWRHAVDTAVRLALARREKP